MAQRKQYPAILLLVGLVTVPFLVVAVLLLQYRVGLHEGYQRMLDDVRLFRIGLAVTAPLEETRDLAPARVHLEVPDLEARFLRARRNTEARLDDFVQAVSGSAIPSLLDQVVALRREWRELSPATGLAGRDVSGPFDNVEQINGRLHNALAAVLYMGDIAVPTRPSPNEALSLPLNGLRQLSHDLGIIRAIAVYTSLNGGYLSTVDLRQLERALARLEELIPQVEGQIQALASRTDQARLRQQWRTTHAELESYLQWSRQTLLLPSRVTVTWQEALAEGGDRQQRLRDLSEDITGVAVMLVEQGRGKSLRDSGLIAAGLLVLYLLVLVLSLVFFHFATRAIRGRAEVRAKSQFLARMSHEIRTPLNGVLGLAELLRETNPSPRQQEYIGLIENAGRTLNTLVNDVLDYAKLEAGKLELEQSPFDPAALLIDCAHMFSLPASDNGDLVLVDADADIPAQLRGDAPRLRQVLTNLLSNAIKFTRHGWIRVGARCLEQRDGRAMIEFTVSDSGIGMTREEQRRLFQNFSQASASVAQRFGGTGLGLSISQELVRLMGGDIEVRSAPEQGTTFRFVIPLPVLEKAVPMPEWTSVPALVWDPVGNLGELLQRDPRFSRVRVVDDLAAVQRALSEDDSGHLLVNGVSDGVLLDQGLRPARERHAGLRPVLLCGMRESGEVVMRDDITLVRRAVLTVTELQQLISDSGPGQVPLLSEREPVDTQGGLRVLVAEDNPVNQMVTRGYLERLGVPGPVLSDDGRKALEAFTAGEGRYRLVLMDLDMPDMDGFESATRMRRLEQEKGWPPAVILALSAHVLPEYAGRIRDAGMDGQLIKPLTLSAMQAALHQYLTVDS